MFWPYSIFFEPGQIFLSIVKSDIWPYNFGYLTIFKNIEQDQKILNTFKKEFELADGLGIQNFEAEITLFMTFWIFEKKKNHVDFDIFLHYKTRF